MQTTWTTYSLRREKVLKILSPKTSLKLAFAPNRCTQQTAALEKCLYCEGRRLLCPESTWADLWLSEGFATYFAGLFVEKYDGEAAFHDYMRDKAGSYFRYAKQNSQPLHDTSTQDLMQLLNPNNYEKGAWVLHMLRVQLGDEAFFKGLRNYYLAHASATASSEDLRKALEAASGQNLRGFFARWVYGSGHPRYELRWDILKGGRARPLKITVSQVQAGSAFLDPYQSKS
jgi:aminopeptidase N